MSMYRCFFIILVCMSLSSCVVDRLKFWESAAQIPYEITGLEDEEKAYIYISSIVEKGLSEELEDKDDMIYLAEAVRGDALKGMHAIGYYEAKIALTQKDEAVQFDVEAGEITSISSVSVIPAKYLKSLELLSLRSGDTLSASKVLAAQSALYQNLQKDNCAFNLDVSHQVILDPSTNMAEVIFKVKQGRQASFGTLTYTGSESVNPKYLGKVAAWEQGACFRRDRVDAVRDNILSTGLFSRVDAVLPAKPDAQGVVPVGFELKERAPRTLSAGLSYYTDEGVGVSLGWEHRNFFGSGEKVNADFDISLLQQSLGLTMSKPYFVRDDQNLSLNALFEREDNDAFDQLAMGVGFGIKRKFTNELSGRLGMDFEITRVTEDNGPSENYALLSPVASLTYDTRNDTLDPYKGSLLKISVAPSIDAFGESDPFITNEITAQSYYKAHKRLVVAARAHIGSIVGATTDNLPASERFFAGGGGSVRGFGYQEVGPFDGDDPLGGRSLIEGSFELRYKATDKIGVVVFTDVGQVDERAVPSFDNLAVGAGLGFRYYTDFAPLRFDVGVPLKGDENTDQNFQIYISIGQAF